MKKKHKVEAVLLICILFISIFNIPVVKVKAEDNMNYPKELMLGTFFNSEKDMTDTLYVSFDGYTFYKIGEAYTDKYPNSRSAYQIVGYGESQITDIVDNDTVSNKNLNIIGCFHDPSIMYKDGYFAQWNGGESVDDKMSPYLIKVSDLSVDEEEIQRIANMAHGLTTLPNGNVYYYDDITGIRQ